MTRDELLALTRSYARRNISEADFDASLPLAEARIGRDLMSAENHYSDTVNAIEGTSGQQYAMPDDFRRFDAVVRDLDLEPYYLRDPADVLQKRLHDNRSNADKREFACFLSRVTRGATGQPLALVLDPWHPAGDAGRIILYYFGVPAALTSQPAPAHHAASVHPDIYVHGVLMEIGRITADDAMRETGLADYSTAVDLANALGVANRSGDDGHVLPDRVIGG